MNEKFPQPKDENESSLLVDALIAGDVEKADRVGTLGRDKVVWLPGRYIAKNPLLEKKERAEFDIIAQIPRGSVAEIACRILVENYGALGFHINEEAIDQDNGELVPECFDILVNSEKTATIFKSIIENPIIKVLMMENSDVDYTDGIAFEEKGLLKRGITKSAYLRFLSTILLGHEDVELPREDMKKLEGYKKEVELLLKRGTESLSDEEAEPIIKLIVDEVIRIVNQQK